MKSSTSGLAYGRSLGTLLSAVWGNARRALTTRPATHQCPASLGCSTLSVPDLSAFASVCRHKEDEAHAGSL